MTHIGNHSAGDLVTVPSLIEFARFTDRQPFALGDPREVLAHGRQRIDVDQRLVTEGMQVIDDVEHRRLGGAVGERWYRRVDDTHTLLHCFEQIEWRQAVVAVGVKLERNVADVLFDESYQVARAIRR